MSAEVVSCFNPLFTEETRPGAVTGNQHGPSQYRSPVLVEEPPHSLICPLLTSEPAQGQDFLSAASSDSPNVESFPNCSTASWFLGYEWDEAGILHHFLLLNRSGKRTRLLQWRQMRYLSNTGDTCSITVRLSSVAALTWETRRCTTEPSHDRTERNRKHDNKLSRRSEEGQSVTKPTWLVTDHKPHPSAGLYVTPNLKQQRRKRWDLDFTEPDSARRFTDLMSGSFKLAHPTGSLKYHKTNFH